MLDLSASSVIYILFLFVALITGLVYWIRAEYRIGSVLALIFSLSAPLLTIFIIAQQEGGAGPWNYLFNEVKAGSVSARLVTVMYLYLVGWLLFLAGKYIVKMTKSQSLREHYQKFVAKLNERKANHEDENRSKVQ